MEAKKQFPWIYVPTLFFMQGVPYVVVNGVSMVMFKKLGVPNGQLAFWTSLIGLPWMLKMFWGPVVDRLATKRLWVLGTQFFILALLGVLATLTKTGASWNASLGILAMMAVFSATHDIASDGFYMLSLDEKQQAFFVGITSTAYRAAMVFGTGFIVYLAGVFESRGFSVAKTWGYALTTGAMIYGMAILVGMFFLPKPINDGPVIKKSFGYSVFKDYFTQPKIFLVLGFILFYRFSESMISRMSAPFFIDAVSKGGLGLSTQDVGFIGGVVGVASLTLGGIAGGFVLSRYGIKRCIWPLFISMNVVNLFYVWASMTHPSRGAIFGVVGVDQFGYGFGFAAYMVYLMYLSKRSSARTAHFAISTGLMAFGAMMAGAVSGYLQEWLGYTGFFVATLVLTVPGMLILRLLPFEDDLSPALKLSDFKEQAYAQGAIQVSVNALTEADTAPAEKPKDLS